MNKQGTCYKATVDGLGKKGGVYTFLIGLGAVSRVHLNREDTVTVEDVSVTVSNFEDNYLSFECSLEEVFGTRLAQVEVGSEVVVRF